MRDCLKLQKQGLEPKWLRMSKPFGCKSEQNYGKHTKTDTTYQDALLASFCLYLQKNDKSKRTKYETNLNNRKRQNMLFKCVLDFHAQLPVVPTDTPPRHRFPRASVAERCINNGVIATRLTSPGMHPLSTTQNCKSSLDDVSSYDFSRS